MTEPRSLYQCMNARCRREEIICAFGFKLGKGIEGIIPVKWLQRGKPLIFDACQKCTMFDDMGPDIPPSDRGWRE